jgi:ATP-dependent HslUV protease subunit HslV
MSQNLFRATTVLALLDKGNAAIGADGQVTMGETIMKAKAAKIRKIYNDKILTGFAGATADAFTLFERFESKIDQYSGYMPKAAVDLAKEWRTDKYLRRLEALLVILDKKNIFMLSGTGDVIEPDDGIVAIGSGGPYALAAARALKASTKLPVADIVRKSLEVAASICVYTNSNIVVETL